MQIPKAMLVERLRSESGHEATERADKELPDKVDLQNDAETLKGLGLDPEKLAEDFRGQAPAVG